MIRSQVAMATPMPISSLTTIFFSLTLIASILSVLALRAHADHVLYAGEALAAGQNLTNGQFQLAMQSNCDLVLYDSGKPMWQANIYQEAQNCYLRLKHTGKLVVCGHVHYPLWSSNARSKKKGKYVLVLDRNGTLAVYGGRLWSSNNKKALVVPDPSPVSTEYVLYMGDRLASGEKLVYRNYELVLDKCNMAVNDTKMRKLLWQTMTQSDDCYLQLESNGVLTLNHDNKRIWSSNKKAVKGMYIAVVRFDGRVAVYGPSVWSNTKTKSYDDRSSRAFEPWVKADIETHHLY